MVVFMDLIKNFIFFSLSQSYLASEIIYSRIFLINSFIQWNFGLSLVKIHRFVISSKIRWITKKGSKSRYRKSKNEIKYCTMDNKVSIFLFYSLILSLYDNTVIKLSFFRFDVSIRMNTLRNCQIFGKRKNWSKNTVHLNVKWRINSKKECLKK